MNIGPIVEEDLRGHWVSNRTADVLILAAVIRRWHQLGINVERLIYVFENQPWERGICWEAKRSFPGATLVGYQHSRAPKMLLSYHLAKGGEAESPLPHRLVTVGNHTARLLSEGGYAKNHVRVGGAFQMEDLFKLKAQENLKARENPAHPGSVRPTVLVACSEGLEETAELAGLAVKLFDEDDGVRVVLKFHPVTPYSLVRRFMGDDLPEHIQLSDEPIIDLMLQSSVMLYTGSTVCVQALALGLPVVHLRPQYEFDLDPLEGTPQARLEAAGLEELGQQVRWLLDNREHYIAQNRDEWDRLVDDMYAPVTSASYQAFLD